MEDSLKKQLQDKIKSVYPRVFTTDELKIYLEEINSQRRLIENKEYKLSNAERRLRPSESPRIKTIRNDKSYIIGYQYAPIYEEFRNGQYDYDFQLKELRKCIKPSFDNYKSLKDIQGAIACRNEYRKRSVLELYKGYWK